MSELKSAVLAILAENGIIDIEEDRRYAKPDAVAAAAKRGLATKVHLNQKTGAMAKVPDFRNAAKDVSKSVAPRLGKAKSAGPKGSFERFAKAREEAGKAKVAVVGHGLLHTLAGMKK